MNEPYYIDWKDHIKNNIDVIKNRIYDNIMEMYKIESSNLFYFYSYWREFCPDNEKKPSDFIRFLKDEINHVKTTNLFLPTYIEDYFTQIGFEIQMSKGNKNKEQILINNGDVVYFTQKIEKQLEISIRRYLAMKIEDDDDDE
jgi:hypothetical protein